MRGYGMRGLFSLLVVLALSGCSSRPENILLISVDDMNWDSVGIYGSEVPDITPHIDRLAAEGMRFRHAHVTIAVCQPSRAVWMTGRYPHRSGALGFDAIRAEVPTLVEALAAGGYFTGLLSKVSHVVPSRGHAWDVVVPAEKLASGRGPDRFYRRAKRFFEKAQASGKPFFLMANAGDPHRPYPGISGGANPAPESGGSHVPRIYSPEEIEVPGFVPDLPEVRNELARYFTAVHRADQTVGALLQALDESGRAQSTLVVFLSDHGMDLPFAKTNVYRDSTRTPWIVRWPGVVAPGTEDTKHLISGIDLAPTLLEAAGFEPLEGMDGRSFVPLLEGRSQGGREYVFTYLHRTVLGDDYPMRSVQDARFGYIYNAWADGKTVFVNQSQNTPTMKAMKAAAATDAGVAARVDFFLHRTPEEFYDYERDPHALHNLIDDPTLSETIPQYRQRLAEHMRDSQDPVYDRFRRSVGGPP